MALVTVARETPVSLNLRLLEDLRTVFLNRLVAIQQAQPHGLSTKTIVDDLCALEDSPWQTINKGERLSPDQLSRRLRDYSVKRTNLRLTPGPYESRRQGYPVAPLADAWRRYSPSLIPCDAVPPVTPVTKPTFESYFEIAPGTEGTENYLATGGNRGKPAARHTSGRPAGQVVAQADGAVVGRVNSSPGRGAGQKRNYAETLANELPDITLDAEVGRISEGGKQAQSETGYVIGVCPIMPDKRSSALVGIVCYEPGRLSEAGCHLPASLSHGERTSPAGCGGGLR